MIRVSERAGITDSSAVQDELVLEFDMRKRGRLRTQTVSGQDIGLFLERGQPLRDGDGLRTELGTLLRVRSAPEPVMTASCKNALIFARACYHLGNRHTPLQVGNNWLRFKPDHVLAELVKSLGMTVTSESAPFEPEDGAYGKHSHHHH